MMKSRECQFYAAGLCPDTEFQPASGRPVDLFVALPYCADERHERLVRDVLAPAAGLDPQAYEISRTIACRLESEPSHSLLLHCGGRRLAHSIRHSGAAGVYAVGRGAAEIEYPVPAYFSPDPALEKVSPDVVLRPFLLAVEESCRVPEMIRLPSMKTIFSQVEDAEAVAMHIAGGLLYWAARPGVVCISRNDPAVIETLAESVGAGVSFDLPEVWSAAPGAVLRARWLDLSAKLMLPVRGPALCNVPDLFGDWLELFLESVAALAPDIRDSVGSMLEEDVTYDRVDEAIGFIGAVYDELEPVVGPPPPVGDRGAAILTSRAVQISTTGGIK